MAAAAGLALAATLLAQEASAADVVAACENSPAGTFTAGYLWGQQQEEFFFKKGVSDTLDTDYSAFFGEAAALYNFCDYNMNIQLDGAWHAFNVDDSAADEDRWHVGGILFWRNADLGLLGIDASYIGQDYDAPFISDDHNQLRVGLRGEFFAHDIATIGAGAGLLNGEYFGKDIHGFDANLWARIYPHENISLLGRFDYSTFEFDDRSDYQSNFWSVTGEIEGKLPEWPVTAFVGARYGEFEVESSSFSPEEHTQLYLGFRIYLGGDTSSLRSAHRTNTLDNTNMRWERFPEIINTRIR